MWRNYKEKIEVTLPMWVTVGDGCLGVRPDGNPITLKEHEVPVPRKRNFSVEEIEIDRHGYVEYNITDSGIDIFPVVYFECGYTRNMFDDEIQEVLKQILDAVGGP